MWILDVGWVVVCGLWFKYFGGQMVVWQGGSPTHIRAEIHITRPLVASLTFASSSITGSCMAPYIVNLSDYYLLIHFKIISNNSA